MESTQETATEPFGSGVEICLGRADIGVRAAPPAEGRYNVDESSVVLHAPLGSASLLLLLFLLVHLRGLSLDLSGTGQGSVHLTCRTSEW